MSGQLDETHNAATESWVASANTPETDFPIQNLPYGVFQRKGGDEPPRVGIAIGDQVLDVAACLEDSLFSGSTAGAARACAEPALNRLMGLGSEYWTALRRRLHELLRADSAAAATHQALLMRRLIPQPEVTPLPPAVIGDYTDFYASIDHATNVGKLFRPENPLLPNYKYLPIAYHGRASSVVPSGAGIRRPSGQVRGGASGAPVFAPSARLDYELELGFFIGPGNPLGKPISVEHAAQHIFGACLVNDWSARDIQAWEYQPLGPFLGKSFATTISCWVVTADALAPFRVATPPRARGDPAPLAYLVSGEDQTAGALQIQVEAWLSSRSMRERGFQPICLTRSNSRDLYWTAAQFIAHHTSNGCNLRPGDLLASGTVSGKTADSLGCLLELTRNGAEPLALPGGEKRQFLEDGDEVVLRGFCQREGFRRIGFGDCRGQVLPAGR
ncbi:MAG: fumarylacetoacetase [Terriglobia bacterium]